MDCDRTELARASCVTGRIFHAWPLSGMLQVSPGCLFRLRRSCFGLLNLGQVQGQRDADEFCFVCCVFSFRAKVVVQYPVQFERFRVACMSLQVWVLPCYV